MGKKDIVPEIEEVEAGEKEIDFVDKTFKETIDSEPPIPDRLSVEWSDYIMTLFDKSEIALKKNNWGKEERYPRVHGLRRIAQKYVGEIIESVATCVGPASCLSNGGISPTSYVYTVKFQKPNGRIVTYSDAADVYYFSPSSNNADESFARYPSAMASTRAEARALRKALGLTICSAEEIAAPLQKGPQEPQKETIINTDEQVSTYIVANQIHYLGVNCERVDINPWKFINSGSVKYKGLKDIPFTIAQELCKIVGGMVRAKNLKKPEGSKEEFAKNNKTDLGKFSKTWQNDNVNLF